MRIATLTLSAVLSAGPSLAQRQLFAWRGELADDSLGAAVASAGDVNDDGVPDLIVGVPGHDKNGRDSGAVYVYSGATGVLLHEKYGAAIDDKFGWSVSGAGDVNKDGFADFIVGAPWHDTTAEFNAGSASVYSGKDGGLLYLFEGERFREIFGISVAAAGDVDKDGFPDLIVGAHGDDQRAKLAGSASLFSGRDGKLIRKLLGDDAFDFFGNAVCAAGDIDRDGYADVAIGAPDDDNNGADSGMVRVHSGQDGKVLYTFNGDGADDFFGSNIGLAGDVNDDGFPDLIVGANEFFGVQPGKGYARVYSGKDGSALFTFRGATDGGYFSSAVAGARDVDKDGTLDILVGACLENVNGADAGSLRVFSGRDGSLLWRVDGAPGDQLGYAAASAGDVHPDGWADLIVGAPFAVSSAVRSGAARVLSGRTLFLTTDVHMVSLATGGVQTMRLEGGVKHANKFYLVLGSALGTKPGVKLTSEVHLDLNQDDYMLMIGTNPNLLIRDQARFFDAAGRGEARFALPKTLPPVLVGTLLHHACVVMDISKLSIDDASNARPLTFVR